MELKTLVLGIFLSTAAFALKSGGGLAYLFLTSTGRWARFRASALFAAGYGLVFGAAALLLYRVDFIARLDLVQDFFKSGMTLHFILAGLLLVWGVGLLSRDRNRGKASRTWLALVAPCPVCFSVILISMGFVTALYPDSPLVAAALYAGFLLVSLGTAFAGARLVRGLAPGAGERALGTLMVYISAYFLLSVTLVPGFADLGRIYRISLSGGPGTLSAEGGATAGVVLAALAAGYFNPFNRKV